MEISTILTYCCIIIALLLFKLYRYFTEHFDYFKLQGIPYVKPTLVFGIWYGVWNKKNNHIIEMERYKKYGKIFGIFNGRQPQIVVSDLNALRNIFVKDFEHFVNRSPFPSNNDILDKNLSTLEDAEWKEMRQLLSPAFTTGKIKRMINLMNEPAESFVKHLMEQPEKTKINMRIKVTSFIMDITATCGFGIKIDSLNEPNNPFVVNGLKFFSPELEESAAFVLAFLYPNVAKHFMPASAFDGFNFFADVARKIINERKAQSTDTPKRGDFVDLIIEATNSNINSILQKDEAYVVAQLGLFLIAGLDTSAFTMSTVLHCLAMNPEVQDKVRNELVTVMKQHGGEINYDVIRELNYMDQCVLETMRMFPIATRLDRMCNKDVEYDSFKVKKGVTVVFPIYALHMDPQYYPNPEKFDPNRFSTEEKNKRDPLAYLPFGYGNRNCIGMRLALDSMKLGISHLLANFKFIPVPETIDPPNVIVGFTGRMQSREFLLGIEKLA